MTFHHDKHFAGYTKKMNAALAALRQADSSADLNLTPEVILSLVESYNDDDFEKVRGAFASHCCLPKHQLTCVFESEFPK